MIRCSHCSYAWNLDSATNCIQCRAQLEVQRRRGTGTRSYGLVSDSLRRQTVAEGVSYGIDATSFVRESRRSSIFDSEMPQPRWGNMQAVERDERRRTVFAGSSSAIDPSAPDLIAPDSTAPDLTAADLVAPDLLVPAFSASGLSAGISTGKNRRVPTAAVDPTRRIVGILVTYSWQPQGELFPVLEGRNLIGRDPDLCDICIPQDATLSAVNSFITYRRQFVIGDRVSVSGTDVNGEPIESEFVPLHNYAKIRTGSTHWTFVEIPPPSL